MPGRPSPRAILLLYRDILRLHRAKLPGPMREVGDKYVKSEFRRHKEAQPPPTDGQWAEFNTQWSAYIDMMRGTADLPGGRAIDEGILGSMSAEQQARLQDLEREARRVGLDMMSPSAPPEDGSGSSSNR